MKYTLPLIAIVTVILGQIAYADDPKFDCDVRTYSCYEKHVENICNARDEPFKSQWGSGPDLGALKSIASCKYPELDKDKINNTIRCIETLEQSDSTALQDGVSMSSMGASNGFRIAELSRLMYRRNMNSIFACGVIASRYSKLDSLNTILIGKQGSSEIQESINKERKRYETLKNQMSCDQNRPANSSTGVVERLMKSSMKEYCKYTYYLDYVDANLRENFDAITKLDTKIGDNNSSKSASTTNDAQKEIISRGRFVEDERKRANEVLPKAIVAFQEMDRTYVIHIMLTFLYDDYLKLRDQLNIYLTTIGQTFEKAFNAQDDNQR